MFDTRKPEARSIKKIIIILSLYEIKNNFNYLQGSPNPECSFIIEWNLISTKPKKKKRLNSLSISFYCIGKLLSIRTAKEDTKWHARNALLHTSLNSFIRPSASNEWNDIKYQNVQYRQCTRTPKQNHSFNSTNKGILHYQTVLLIMYACLWCTKILRGVRSFIGIYWRCTTSKSPGVCYEV